MSSQNRINLRRIRKAFDRDALRRICTMPEADFGEAFGFDEVVLDQSGSLSRWRGPDEDRYFFQDNDASILAVAHLDTVASPSTRACHFLNTQGGEVVYSRALDDRLGAYIILDLLPKLGLNFDILLTVGEESGRSTADFFEPPTNEHGEWKEYNWMIEFDRGGKDVVMYQYDDVETRALVRASGARVGDGSFSDIAYLEHLGVKGFNWGVGYRDYHGARSHAFLDDTFEMVAHFLNFHDQNKDNFLSHVYGSGKGWWGSLGSLYDDDKDTPVILGSGADDVIDADDIDALDTEAIDAPDDLDDDDDPTITITRSGWGIYDPRTGREESVGYASNL